ncbi:FtsK/SpoIIIE family DNA translocase [Vallitalea guaymasensis]|uniref:DNA translocase FtsK 4TM domain-containing protein n=1 Tax=Vallitalea guaymasensis TaxID=1185412 RepID=A0A8J8MFV3_9FIRM|nr:DNA translocase FtsK [Vallitalea guaymasensis]QUH31835.1 DNA translocase FtsK 4TM domain-containing protein [Vallitalea guaymasensis]
MAPKKKTSTKSPKKKTSTKKTTTKKKDEELISNDIKYEIIALTFFAFSLLMFVSVYFDKAGALGRIINNLFFGLFGVSAYLIPIIIFLASFFKIFNKGNKLLNNRIYLGCILLLTISIFAHVTHIKGVQILKVIGLKGFLPTLANYYKLSTTRVAGGYLGGLFGDLLILFIGKIGTYIVLILLLIIIIILLTQKSLFKFIKNIGKKVKDGSQNVIEKSREARENMIEEYSKYDEEDEKEDNNEKVSFLSKVSLSIDDEPIENFLEEEKEVVHKPIEEKYVPQKEEIKQVEVIQAKEPTKSIESTDKTIEEEIQKDQPENVEYKFPSIDLLKKNPLGGNKGSKSAILKNADKLEKTLESFGVRAKVLNVSCGPTVTRYELQPEQGVKVSKIVSLADDIALNLAASGIRIEAPIPGKSAVGIEVPNKEVSSVYLREVIDTEDFKQFPSNVAFALGKDIAGKVIVADIGRMPHMLIAGATGSGKSVCINTLITSIIYKSTPEQVKLVMIDPKVVELSVYNGIPHLLIPVVTDPKKAAGALNWAVSEMSDRYKLFAASNVRDVKGYNKLVAKTGEGSSLPHIIIIVDELADLMMVAPNDVEDAICRLAQMARAAGIHLIIATQRPSVDVITGLIKANIPSRIAFSVSSGTDSRTIIDMNGAEKLLGKGDMLFYPVGVQKPLRVQGAFISDKEVEHIVEFLKESRKTIYNDKIISQISSDKAVLGKQDDKDDYYNEALELVIEKQKASASMIQRRFRVGYNRAARIVDQLHESGIVGGEEGSKPRKVLITKEEYEEMKNQVSATSEDE